jgi:hypothetical protein
MKKIGRVFLQLAAASAFLLAALSLIGILQGRGALGWFSFLFYGFMGLLAAAAAQALSPSR